MTCTNDENLGAAATDLDDDGFRGRQGRYRLDEGLNPHVRYTVDFGFVERLDDQAGRDENAVDENELVGGFTNGTGRNDPNLFRARDAVLEHRFAILREHLHTFFDRIPSKALKGEGVFAERHRLRMIGENADTPASSISAIAMRTLVAPISITATGRVLGVEVSAGREVGTLDMKLNWTYAILNGEQDKINVFSISPVNCTTARRFAPKPSTETTRP